MFQVKAPQIGFSKDFCALQGREGHQNRWHEEPSIVLSPAKAGPGLRGTLIPALKRWATKNGQSIAAAVKWQLPPVSQHYKWSPEVRMRETRIAHHGELSTPQAFRF